MRYTIQQKAERQFVVLDNQTQEFTKSRFHTFDQANEWVDEQNRKALLNIFVPQTSMGGRARAYQLTDRDYYGSNEKNIRLLG